MELRDYYKKVDHKVTLKNYHFIDWYFYHYYNNKKFRVIANLIYIIYIIAVSVIASYVTATIICGWHYFSSN